jgi:prepilin-type N-terminal cleavage/methylation domain-containing protein
MLQRIRDARENEQGFTLIELLIVIVILGVLSAVVVFSVQAFNNEGKASACKADAKNVEIAAEAFLAKTGAAPASINALVTANYLKQAPPTTNGYTITLTGTTVTASGACTYPAPVTP